MKKHHCHEQQFHAHCFGQQKHPMHEKVKLNSRGTENIIYCSIEEKYIALDTGRFRGN